MTNISVRLPTGEVKLDIDRRGNGRPLLLLHGGAGPVSMRPLFSALDEFEIVLPTHPGFDGTERPHWLASIGSLADCYIALLEELDLKDAIVIGNSAGGWIAAEMAARQSSSLAGIILINAVGLQTTESTGPIIDPRAMPPEELIKLSFADPTRARPPSPGAVAQRQTNMHVLMIYAGDPFMHDPALEARLSHITVPSLVLWGQRDRIVTPDYGQEYARRIPDARFEMIYDAGHLPQIEQTEQTASSIRAFCAALA